MGTFVKDTMNVSTAAFQHLNESSSIIECIWFTIVNHNMRKIIVGIIYRPPGSSTDVNNPRPISLLPLPGKIIERVVHTQLSEYLEHCKLLNEHQGGFRKSHSTVNTVSEFTDDILLNINQNKCTLTAFIDLRKAFDTVNHTILLRKTELLGVHPGIIEWLKSYLIGRIQRTSANNCISQDKVVVCGVPQGSSS